MSVSAELLATHTARVSAFVVRARRVTEHLLYREHLDSVKEVAQGTMRLQRSQDGSPQMVFVLPAVEEMLESATARVRPLVLDREPSHGLSAIASLGYLLGQNPTYAGDENLRDALRAAKKAWNRFSEGRMGSVGFTVQQIAGTTMSEATFEQLAWAWVYGDVVHAIQERRDATAAFGVRERYKAGAILTCQIMLHAGGLLHLVTRMQELGIIAIPEDAFTEQVTVGTEPIVEENVTVYAAPYVDGVAPQVPSSPDAPIPPDFKRVT